MISKLLKHGVESNAMAVDWPTSPSLDLLAAVERFVDSQLDLEF